MRDRGFAENRSAIIIREYWLDGVCIIGEIEDERVMLLRPGLRSVFTKTAPQYHRLTRHSYALTKIQVIKT